MYLRSPLMLFVALVAELSSFTHAAGDSKTEPSGGRLEMDLSGPGWSLWQDKGATWQ